MTWWTEPFVWRAVLGGVLVALPAALLGCFVLWRRMAYFGDALSHGALLGVALGYLAGGAAAAWALPLFCLAAGLWLAWEGRGDTRLALDARLALLAHGGLAAGLVLFAAFGSAPADIHGYLFGDVFLIDGAALAQQALAAGLVLTVVVWGWRRWLFVTVSAELAQVEGLAVRRWSVALLLLLAGTVAASIPLVGVLLTAALLVVPAAGARALARSAEAMAVLACAFALAAVLGGLAWALYADLPAGPAVVLVALALAVLARAFGRR